MQHVLSLSCPICAWACPEGWLSCAEPSQPQPGALGAPPRDGIGTASHQGWTRALLGCGCDRAVLFITKITFPG